MNHSAACRPAPLELVPGSLRRDSTITSLRSLPWPRASAPTGGSRGQPFPDALAVKENVAAWTQNQALAALLFLYQHVLEQPLNRIEGVVRARRPKRLPVVLTREEVERVLAHLNGVPHLLCTILYGAGLRLLEGLQLDHRR